MANPYVVTPVTSGYGLDTALNTELQNIADAISTCLNREDSTDNAMEQDLDMGGNDILNVNSLTLALTQYTVATLPSAAANTAVLVYVSDETGGAVPAFSDGTDWRRVTDRAVVS